MRIDSVKVEVLSGCNDEQLHDFLDELHKVSEKIEVRRHPYGQGGPLELYVVVSLLGAVGLVYLKSFFETLGSEHARALNCKLLKVLQSGEAGHHHRRMFPLRIGAGSVWFHISRPCSPKQLTERFRLAADIVTDLDDDVIASGNLDQDLAYHHYYYWDERSESWQRMPVGEYGPELPDIAG